jgi:hypothetical protein
MRKLGHPINDELRANGNDGIQSASRCPDISPAVIGRSVEVVAPTAQDWTNIPCVTSVVG